MFRILFLAYLLTGSQLHAQIKIFEPQHISDNRSFGISIAPEGNQLLFVKAYGGRDSLHLFESRRINGKWKKAQKAFFANTNVNQIDPTFSPNGKHILFDSLLTEERGYDVYMLTKTAESWTKPKLLPKTINTAKHEFYATMALNGNIYFTRRNESNDIYVSKWSNEGYSKAEVLKGGINTKFSDSNPYISANEDFLIFISNRDGGYGNTDLYISFKNKDDFWSTPQNLGDFINTKASEFCPTIALKTKRFLFSRTIIQNEIRIENIYELPLRKLQLKKKRKQAIWPKQ
ncbi:hypothetical protein M3P19_03775 [Muricauda sp. 2012CJ35-5]|uniref:WD40 repeat protein n=1 Tax=Flagellimonas spongiicola TaxID=2942208 RepID=A0ABT0PQY7_9FLAO|nr:hypothetical protein [Allomuricauda spongiicola]MCL6273112.1 hypothetical protein [Allomuricauda spongiicola]